MNLIFKIFKKKSHPLNLITLSKQKLINNFNFLNSLNPKVKVAPVLKSNAYGHGIVEIGKVVDKLNPPFICVDSLYEAYKLKKDGIKSQILIMGYIDPKSLALKKLTFSYAVWDLELVKVIDKYQKGAAVHVFVDTGMHREGVEVKCTMENDKCTNKENCLLHFLIELKKLENIKIEGLMSHLAEGTNPNSKLTLKQVKNFNKALQIVKKLDINLKYTHLSASAGIFTLKNNNCNIARVGKALYGIDPVGDYPKLKPVLELATKIVQIKVLEKGETVGYDATFKALKKTKIAVLPIGYNDGVDRRLSNKGWCLVGEVWCRIIGRVSMNLTTIDISNVKSPYLGEEVVVFSADTKAKNSIKNSSKIAGTIPYDLLVRLDSTTKRILT